MSTETVTYAGSGLVFDNTYSANVSSAYQAAIIAAENYLQQHFNNNITISVDFDFAKIGDNLAAENSFSTVNVSYADFVSALTAHATTGTDALAVAGLPTTDPSGGKGFDLPLPEARLLGFSAPSDGFDLTVTLSNSYPWTFGQDAVSAIIHEITEGGFGRIGSLGTDDGSWEPMDLFRFNSAGQRDFTGGADGQETYFGVDGAHLDRLLNFHNAINSTGANDGGDLADWDSAFTDSFGPAEPGTPGSISNTDLVVLDILGWTPSATSFTGNPGADWLTGSSWLFGSAPTVSDDVVIDHGGYTPSVAATETALAHSVDQKFGELVVAGSLTVATTFSFEDGASIALAGGVLTVPTLTVTDPTLPGYVFGYGTINASLTGNLRLNLNERSTVINGNIADSVNVLLGQQYVSHAALEINGVVGAASFDFQQTIGSALTLDDPAQFSGKLINFTAADSLDLHGIAATSVAYDGKTLTIDYGTNQSLQYSLVGYLSGYTVSSQNDGSGGTEITWNPTTPTGLADSIITYDPWASASLVPTNLFNGEHALTGTAPAFSTVTVYSGSTVIGTAVASSEGTFSLPLGHLADGVYTYTATATNYTGVTTALSAPFVLNLVTTVSGTSYFYNVFRDFSVQLIDGTGTVTGGTDAVIPAPSGVQYNHVANFHFFDGTLTFDPNSASAEVMRMYDTAFHRAPDYFGGETWTKYLEGGGSLQSLADKFAASAEFQADVAGMTNQQIVDYMYENTLHRAPDPGGEAVWTSYLNSGHTIGDLVLQFSESAEHVSDTIGAVNAGMWDANLAYETTEFMYQAAFGRVPDHGGLIYWSTQVLEGLSEQAMAVDFANSTEFQNDIAGKTHQQIVDFLYQTALHRAPDPGGEAAWTAYLDAGNSPAQLLLQFEQSAELRSNLISHIDHGAWF